MSVRTETPVANAWRRTVGSYGGTRTGPLLVVVCGIHGNEPAGVRAAEAVFERLERERPELRGEVLAIGGNLAALAANRRYLEQDLNRLWLPDRIHELEAGAARGETLGPDEREQLGMWTAMKAAFARS